MGLIQAAFTATSSAMHDTYRDFFYCDSMPSNVLVVKGAKRTGKGSANKKGNENIISNGSLIAVADGQCMIIVDQGQVVDFCAVAGEYTYDQSSEPSLFYGSLGANIKETFKLIGKRIGFGGDAGHDQRVYYFNIKELIDNKFGTQNPIPFRMTYQDIGRNFTAGVRCNGLYSYKITDPMLFYKNVCGNVSQSFTRADIEGQLKSEFLSALQPAFAKLSSHGIMYDQLPAHTLEICDAMNDALKNKWKEHRGISIVSISINSVTISKEDEDRIKKYEDIAWNREAGNAAATMVGAQADAMTAAANNANGAAMGFYGMNMAQQAGGLNANALFQMGSGSNNNVNTWICSCGTSNTGKFCANCGKSKPAPENSWTCSCGAVNKGKFCSECGKKKPAGAPIYKCDKCGWEPDDPFNPPKFCAECGDPFDDNDIVK